MTSIQGQVVLEWAGSGSCITQLDVDISTSFNLAARGKAAKQCAEQLQQLLHKHFERQQLYEQNGKPQLCLSDFRSIRVMLGHNGCELTDNFHLPEVRTAWVDFAQQLGRPHTQAACADAGQEVARQDVVLSISFYSPLQLALWSLNTSRRKTKQAYAKALCVAGFKEHVNQHPEVLLRALKRCGAVFNVDTAYQHRLDVQLAATTAECRAAKLSTVFRAQALLQSKHRQQHVEVVLASLAKNPHAVVHMQPCLFARLDVVMLSLRVCRPAHAKLIIDSMPREFVDNYQVMSLAVLKDPEAVLQRAGPASPYRDDFDIVKAAVSCNGLVLRLVSRSFHTSEEIVLAAVQQSYKALKYAPELQTCRAFVLKAVAAHGRALKYVSHILQDDTEVVQFAVNKHGKALKYASERCRACLETVTQAITNDASAFEYAADNLKEDVDVYCLACTVCMKTALRFMTWRMQNEPRIQMLVAKYEAEQAVQVTICCSNINTFKFENGMGGPGFV